MEKWNDFVWGTKNIKQLEKIYNKAQKQNNWELMEEIEFHIESGDFWMCNQ